MLVKSALGGAFSNQANMRIENNGVIADPAPHRASTSLNHRTSRLANASHLEEQYKPNSSGKMQKEILQNMIGSIEIKEIK